MTMAQFCEFFGREEAPPLPSAGKVAEDKYEDSHLATPGARTAAGTGIAGAETGGTAAAAPGPAPAKLMKLRPKMQCVAPGPAPAASTATPAKAAPTKVSHAKAAPAAKAPAAVDIGENEGEDGGGDDGGGEDNGDKSLEEARASHSYQKRKLAEEREKARRVFEAALARRRAALPYLFMRIDCDSDGFVTCELHAHAHAAT